jgi:homotetrameric cytidine deaminase
MVHHHETLGHGRDDNLATHLDASMRNVELKARDPDPARTLERALAMGAEHIGVIRQRDTYFGGARGRLKLREQETDGPTLFDELIEYSREDALDARTSTYRRVPVADAATLREALDAAYGTLITVEKRRQLLVWHGVRIHLDEVEGLGSYLEFEALADEDSDLSIEHEKIERLCAELGVEDANLVATSYADILREARAGEAARRGAAEAGAAGKAAAGAASGAADAAAGEAGAAGGVAGESAQELLRAAEAVMRSAHAPYSQFKVGAALRGADGRVYVGSNVENASYPQGQCAETSAIGALIAAGQKEIAEVAVVAEKRDFCPPCGGCRQRLAELAKASTPVHLGRPGGPLKTTTVGELLPLAFELEPPG